MMGIRIRFFTLLSLLLTVVVYAGLGALSAGCGGASSLLGGTTTSGADSVEALSDAETSLYDSGPIDMPVTIAKLDSPSLDSVTVSVEAISSESISTNNLVRYADGDPGYRYTITVAAGGIDYATAPKFFVYNATLDTSAFFDVNVDGSTQGTIDGALGDTIIFASATSDETQVSPFLSIQTGADGSLGVIVLTNAGEGDVLVSQDLMTTNDGRYFITNLNDDGVTSTLSIRNLDGSAIEIVSETLSSPVRVITAMSGDTVVVILQDGSIVRLNASTTWTSTEMESIEGGLALYDSTAYSGYRLFMNSTETVAYMLMSLLDTDGDPNSDFVKMLDLTGGSDSEVLVSTSNVIAKTFIDIGEPDTMYIVTNWGAGSPESLSRFDLTTSWDPTTQSNLLAAREVLIPDFNSLSLSISGIDVSDNGEVVITALNMDTFVQQILLWTEEDGLKEITDETVFPILEYATATIAPDGNYMIFCEFVETDDLITGHLRVHIPSEHAAHEFEEIVTGAGDGYCTDAPGSLYIDNAGFIHAYVIFAEYNLMPQRVVIDPHLSPVFDSLGF